MAPDFELLRSYCQRQDEAAFQELATRYANLVYSVALRICGNSAAAADVAQLTFIRLAQKADHFKPEDSVAGWLHAQARFLALQSLREPRRRRCREALSLMNPPSTETEPVWADIAPELDDAVDALDPVMKEAVILRFLCGLSLVEVAQSLGLSQDAARMRVNRGLERLRHLLRERGVTSSAAGLTAALAANAIQAAPLGLLASAPAFAPSLAAGVKIGLPLLAMQNIKLITGSLLLFAAVGALNIAEYRQIQNLKQESSALRAALDEAQAYNDEHIARLSAELKQLNRASYIVSARRDPPEPPPQSTRAEQPAPRPAPAQVGAAPGVTMEEFLLKTPAEQAAYLAILRRQTLGRDVANPEQLSEMKSLAAKVRPGLDQLEKSPADFAVFQASYMDHVVELGEKKRAQVQQIIQATYEEAVAHQLDAPSRPAPEAEAESWALRRDALDRRATKAVQALLTPEERSRFDSAFLGVMGIDLGIGDGASHRFVENNGQTIVFPSEEKAREQHPLLR